MLTFRKKEKRVAELVGEHIGTSAECLKSAHQLVERYLSDDLEEASRLAVDINHLEGEADRLMREIRDVLYSGAYLPLVRGDIFSVIEAVDNVTNAAESCCDFFINERVAVPGDMHDDFLQIMEESLTSFVELKRALRRYFKPKGKLESVQDHVAKVGTQESLIDEYESKLTRKIFDSDMDMGLKIHLRQAVRRMTRISDRAEDAADQVELASLKSVL